MHCFSLPRYANCCYCKSYMWAIKEGIKQGPLPLFRYEDLEGQTIPFSITLHFTAIKSLVWADIDTFFPNHCKKGNNFSPALFTCHGVEDLEVSDQKAACPEDLEQTWVASFLVPPSTPWHIVEMLSLYLGLILTQKYLSLEQGASQLLYVVVKLAAPLFKSTTEGSNIVRWKFPTCLWAIAETRCYHY